METESKNSVSSWKKISQASGRDALAMTTDQETWGDQLKDWMSVRNVWCDKLASHPTVVLRKWHNC